MGCHRPASSCWSRAPPVANPEASTSKWVGRSGSQSARMGEYFTFPQVSNWMSNGPNWISSGRPVDFWCIHRTSTGLSSPFSRTGLGKWSSSGPVGVRLKSGWCPVEVRLVSSTTHSGVRWTDSTYRTGLDYRTGNWKKSSGPTGLKSIGLQEQRHHNYILYI